MKQDYNALMEQITMPSGCEQRILTALTQPVKRKNPARTIAVLAAAACLLVGSALAAGYQAGVLDAFFQGDTSVLEPYVQYPDSASNGDYRLSLNGAVYDGNTFYAVAVVEGLNEQAAADLKNNKVIAQSHAEFWGQDFADRLLESGRIGPDTFHLTNADSLACKELDAPSDTSRAWQISGTFFESEEERPIGLWVDFMGRDHMVRIPGEEMLASITVHPKKSSCIELTVYATGLNAAFRTLTPDDSLLSEVTILLRDGQALTQEDLGLHPSSGTYDLMTCRYDVNYLFDIPIDPAEIVSISVNGTEIDVP